MKDLSAAEIRFLQKCINPVRQAKKWVFAFWMLFISVIGFGKNIFTDTTTADGLGNNTVSRVYAATVFGLSTFKKGSYTFIKRYFFFDAQGKQGDMITPGQYLYAYTMATASRQYHQGSDYFKNN